MKLRLKQGGIVKLQNAPETIPTIVVADPMSQRISQNNHLSQIMERDATKAEWERKVEAAEKKADERINNEDSNLASQFMFSGETGEWSRGANTNARRAQYVAEELGLDGNKAFLDSYKKDGKTGAIAFGTTLLTAPMAGEFATYGLLGGAARLAGGMTGSAVGSWGLGKVGDWADNRLGTNWMGTTGRIVGGFAGFGAGMGATTPVLRRLATKGITLHMPQETFMKLRSEGFHKNADRVAKSLFKTKYIVNPEEQLMNEITDVQKGKGWQFHVDDFYKTPNIDWETDRPISTSFNKQYYENGLIKPGKSYIDPSGESDYIWFKEDIPYIKPKHSNIIKGLSEDLNTKTNQLVSGQPNHFPLSKGFDPNKPSIEIYEYYPLGNIKMNPKLRLKDQSVGTWGKVKFHTPNQPQPSATTYEVRSLRVPKNRPITEAERLGIPKGERSNPKALEDPYYWGYQQWNQRYNAAVESGNWNEVQRLRDLHFKIKVPSDKRMMMSEDEPFIFAHTTDADFNVFDSKHFGKSDPGFHGKAFYFGATVPTEAKAWQNFTFKGRRPINNYGKTKKYFYIKGSPLELEQGSSYDYFSDPRDGIFFKLNNPIQTNEFLIGHPEQIKLSDAMTFNDNGTLISIVKRDNFHNPDVRYKQGGNLKININKGQLDVNESENWTPNK